MSPRAAIALLCALLASAAQPLATVAEIVALVRDSIAKNESDASLAKALHKLKPGERLDLHTIEELASRGGGPKTAAELDRLREASERLDPPAVLPAFPHDPAPTVEEQRRLVHDAQDVAIHYALSLPDYICSEVVRRYDNIRGGMDLRDTLEIKLSYFDQREDYRLLTVNGRPTVRGYENVGGAISQGEFGSMLYAIFGGETKATFEWNHWTTLRKRPAHVFSFRIRTENSQYALRYGSGSTLGSRSAIVGQHGFVYIDKETRQVLRIAADADVPRGFPVQQASTLLDYDFTTIGGRQFLLPLHAEVRMTAGQLHTRNLVEFHGYRKFTGESTITFQ